MKAGAVEANSRASTEYTEITEKSNTGSFRDFRVFRGQSSEFMQASCTTT